MNFLPLIIKMSLVAVMLLSAASTPAQNRHIVIGKTTADMYKTTLTADGNNSTTVKFELNAIDLIEVETELGKANLVRSFKAPEILEAGEPNLFYLTSTLIIPNTGRAAVEAIYGKYTEIENIEVAPSKGNLKRNIDPKTVPYTKGEVYKRNEFFPQNQVKLQDPFILRDYRGQTVEVYPVQYNPITKVLRIYSEITVQVKHTTEKGENELVSSRANKATEKEFNNVYNSMFLNYTPSNPKTYPLYEDGELLIICHDAFMDAMQPYVDWKRTIGREVTMVAKSAAGASQAAIKTYIADHYNNTDNNLAYVLLVGDAAQVPAGSSSYGLSDNSYGFISGNDSYNEVFIGRFSAETVAHVETQVARTIYYERDISTTDTWLSNGLGIAANEGNGSGHNGGESDYVHMDYIRDTLLNYTYTTVYQEYSGVGSGTNASQIQTRINGGTSVINFTNHGDENGWSVGNYSSSNVNQLTNVNKLPFIFSVACLTGNFANYQCFAEVWMRATNNGQPTGSIANMMSTILQAWTPPMTGQDEMNNLLAENIAGNQPRTYGGVAINGSMKMLSTHGNNGRETHDTWNLFGDPTVMVRTMAPQEMEVSHNPILFLGTPSLTVTCNIEGALAAVSYIDPENGVQTVGKATVTGGVAEIEFDIPITTVMDLTLAITAKNKVTYIGTINARPADEPYVVLESYNLNAAPDYQTTFGVDLTLNNLSEAPYTAYNVHATITTENQYVTVETPEVEIGEVEPGQPLVVENSLKITLAKEVPDGEAITLNVVISGEYDGETYSWEQTIKFQANSPVLEILTFGIAEIEGNGNGRIDPEETVRITIPVKNTGHAKGLPVTVSLSSSLSAVEVQTLTQEHQGLQAGETGNFQFTVVSAADIEPATVLGLTATVESDIFSVTAERSYTMGLLVEDFESGVQSGFNWAYNNNQWGINTEEYYEGNASVKSGATANSSKSVLSITMDVSTEGEISFYRKVSSESNYDKLFFKINGEVKNGTGWSGDLDWEQFTYNVSAGINTFEWSYEKDNSSTGGSDCAWIDYVIFPAPAENPAPATNLYAEKQGSDVVLIWDNPSSEKLLNLTLYRLSEGQATGEWTAIATTEEFFAIDEDWGDLPDGAYQYAVVANYSFMNSAPVFSELLGMNMEVPYTIHINVEDGKATAAGASILLTNIDPTHAFVYDELSGDTGATFDNIWKGVYTLTVTKEGFETYTEDNIEITEEGSHDITLISKVGINETSADGFTLYPNPATDNLTIMTESGNTATLEIYNVNGIIERTIMMTGNKQEVDVSMLNSGIYVLRITDNEKVIIKQFVKK